MSEENKESKSLFNMDVKDLAGLSEPLKRVIDCLDKGISSLMNPFAYKRAERAKLMIEKERSDQNAIIALKEAMAQDMVEVARTSRDRNELHNIAEIYGGAISELQNCDPSKLPAQLPSDEWAAHFYDSSKDCSDDEIRVIWSKILAGEIQSPGKYYKRTLNNLKQLERHEAEWFVNLCKYSIEDCQVPAFVSHNDIIPYNQIQSLMDCGFLNPTECIWEINDDCIIPLKSKRIQIKLKQKNKPVNLPTMTLTDTGMQICQLIQINSDESFCNTLLEVINKSGAATATLL